MYHISAAQCSIHHFPFDEKEKKNPKNLGLTTMITDADEHLQSNFASTNIPCTSQKSLLMAQRSNEGYQLPQEHRQAVEEKESYRAQHITYLKITKKTSTPL
ncbi:hypothetical protein NE237_006887 [Protea cynaroides]|uniref:Uncharacterized protein n=1 Tax=Protea cynaroides TaxID=273540 RepID=A0A9Q0KN37_9MAGN|nr:hypothetical protein NE237_006887 [Protea cynaroides]